MDMLKAYLTKPKLLSKVLITLGVLAGYVFLIYTPGPGVRTKVLQVCTGNLDGIYGIANVLSGGAALRLSPVATGILPFITAGIIFTLASRIIPPFGRYWNTPQAWVRRALLITALGTTMAAIQALSLAFSATKPGGLIPSCQLSILPQDDFAGAYKAAAVMVIGSLILLAASELITRSGIGNGLTILICAGILVGVPAEINRLGQWRGPIALLGVFALLVALVLLIMWYNRRSIYYWIIRQDERDLPEENRRRHKVTIPANPAGLMPLILASILLYAPALLGRAAAETGWGSWLNLHYNNHTDVFYLASLFILTVLFTFYQVIVTYDSEAEAQRYANDGAMIEDVEPGEETQEFLDALLFSQTWRAGLFLGLIAMTPSLALLVLGVSGAFPLGGTSLLIVMAASSAIWRQLKIQYWSATDQEIPEEYEEDIAGLSGIFSPPGTLDKYSAPELEDPPLLLDPTVGEDTMNKMREQLAQSGVTLVAEKDTIVEKTEQ